MARPDTPLRGGSLISLVLMVLAAGVGLRLALVPSNPNLWEDEIIATTHAVQPLDRLLVNVIRNDVHPPFYFLQLHLWGAVSHSDLWFVCNSLLWSFVALASLWAVMRLNDGDAQRATMATAVLSVLPAAVWMSHEVRMYAMLSSMVIWAFHLGHHSFIEDRRGSRLLLAGLSLAIVYTHAIGFVAVLCNGIYALLRLAERRVSAQAFARWLVLYGCVGLLALPLLISNLLHDANLPPATDVGETLTWLSSAMLSDSVRYSEIQWIGGVALFLTVVAGGLARPRTRLITVSFVLAPLVLAIAVSVGAKPLFKTNFFATILSPFVALILAELILSIGYSAARAGAFVLLAVVLGLAAGSHDALVPRSTDFPRVAALIRAEARPGDVLVVPQMSMFWGMAWYLAGPDWGSPLAVASPPSGAWQQVYRRLGPAMVDWLGLLPKTQALQAGEITLVVGGDVVAATRQAARLWLVTFPRADLPTELGITTAGTKCWGRHFGNQLMELALYARSGCDLTAGEGVL